MRLIKEDTAINFLALRRPAAIASAAVLVLGAVAYFVMGGLNYGIDFAGGTLVQVRFSEPQDINEIRGALSSNTDLGGITLQAFGEAGSNEYLIHLPAGDQEQAGGEDTPAARVQAVLAEQFGGVDIRRVESVGPQVGDELKRDALYAVLLALVAILAYVWLRFHWRYSIGAIAATVHDVLIVLTAFVITQKEITLPVVAAVLTVAGYSINDTIVIFDRVRENMRRFQKRDSVSIFNESMNQTLSRTLLTSGTTLFVVLAIYLFGGEIINDFAFALLIGVLVGTYSTLYIASPVVLLLQRLRPERSARRRAAAEG